MKQERYKEGKRYKERKKERKEERKKERENLLDSGGTTVHKLKAWHRRRGKGKDITHHGVQTDGFTSTCIQYTCKTICLISYAVQRRTVKEHHIKIIRKASCQRTLNTVSCILRRGRRRKAMFGTLPAKFHTRTRSEM